MAYNKVVISGINTSKLTVLKESEKMALLREIKETGSKEAKEIYQPYLYYNAYNNPCVQ